MITGNYVRLPEEIDEIIGIKCYESWKLNGYLTGTKIKKKDNGWILS